MTDESTANLPDGEVAVDVDWSDGGVVLAFMNEVAGGRRLLEAVRERVEAGAEAVAVAAPQNLPSVGQIVDRDEARDAALSRVEVTQSVFYRFGIEASGAIFDPDPALALGDAERAFQPREVLLSCLYESRFGFRRRDLVEFAREHLDTPVTHVPVRVDDDAVRWDVTHTLVVGTQTIASPDLVAHLKQLADDKPHRYTVICPKSGELSRSDVVDRLSSTLAELYRSEIDATGQPMSPEPYPAIENAIEHYRVDDILISTLAGQQSKWLEEGLIDKVKELTDKPIEHFEASGSDVAAPAPTSAEEVKV